MKKEIVGGVIYNPVLDELFWAYKGNGSWLNESRIRVSKRKNLNDSIIATGFQAKHFDKLDKYFDSFKKIAEKTSLRRAGSAALDLAYVAAGRFDAFWESHLKIWDCAAGIIIVQEAGGTVVNQYNNNFNLLDDHTLIASNGLIGQKIIEFL